MRRIYINNQEVYIAKNWSIDDKINARTIMSFTIVDMLGLADIYVGSNVLMEESFQGYPSFDDIEETFGDTLLRFRSLTDTSTYKIFAGTIEKIDIYEIGRNCLEYNVIAVDYNQLTDKRLVADSVVNKLAGDVIKEHILPILAQEGITAGDIQDGPLLSKAVFNYDKCSTALDYIKDVTGFVWEIDFDKQLNFYSRNTDIAPFILSNTVQHSRFNLSKNRGKYRNSQLVRAGRGRTNSQVLEKPTPAPDGVSKSFVVRYPIAEKPRIFIDDVEILASEIGVNGFDTNKKFYFSFASNIISQDETEAILTTSQKIEITYVGFFPILVQVEDDEEIEDRSSKELGTSGIYENLKKESTLDETPQALEFAEGLIEKYGIIPNTVIFETENFGLEAGQLLTIQKPLYGIDDSFLIESVRLFADGTKTIYQVKCLDGSSLGGWEEFFKELLKGQREFVIQENEILILLNKQEESISHLGELNIIVYDALFPANDLYPSNVLTPGTVNSVFNLLD